jgi:DNA-binding LacI/PurR family transcriptional regulator
MPEVTIRDVANEAGLSISSVSRILRGGQGHVYPTETHERVKEIAQRLGYRANVAARLLSQSTRTMIGMSVYFTEHPYLNRFLVAVHQELLKHDYDPVLLDAQHLSSESSVQPFPPPHMLAGLISLGVDLQKGWPKHYEALAERIPIVAVQPVSSAAAARVDVIHVDFKSAYLQALEHLTQLGHRNIAYLGVMDNPPPSDRCKNKGWLGAAKHYRLSTDYVIPWEITKRRAPASRNGSGERSDFIYQPESQQAMTEVVKQLTKFPERVTALVCASDEVAIGLQSYLQSQSWHLPRDLSIVGYDGISLGEYVYPSLTTIAPDYSRMAEVAVQRLLELIAHRPGEAAPHHEEFLVEPELILRGSTAAPTTHTSNGR